MKSQCTRARSTRPQHECHDYNEDFAAQEEGQIERQKKRCVSEDEETKEKGMTDRSKGGRNFLLLI
jgi:hypothetical protein